MPKTVIIQPNGKKEYVEGITHEKFGRVLRYVARGLDVFLSGPAGTGKSELARQVAKALGRNFYQASTVTQEHKLTGFLDMKNDYRETQFYKAVKYGGVFCFEELDSCSSEVVVGFNTALSQREFDFGNNELVKAHKDFVVIATGNTTGRGGDEVYTGRTVIDGSSLDRYKNVTIDYSPAIENVIVKGNTEFLEFVHSLRKATKETEIHLIFSYRSMARLLESEQLDSDILELWEMLDEDLIKGMASDDLEQLVANMEINRNNKYFQALRELSQNC